MTKKPLTPEEIAEGIPPHGDGRTWSHVRADIAAAIRTAR